MTDRIEQLNAKIAEVQAEVDAQRAAEAAVAAKRASDTRAREQVDLDRNEQIAAQRASLARDLGDIDVESVPAALGAKSASVTGMAKHVLTPLMRLYFTPRENWRTGGPDPFTARWARHAGAGMKLLPPVRKGDLAFATEATVRALPAPNVDAGSTIADSRHLALLSALGQAIPRVRAPGVESPQDARKRLGRQPITLAQAAFFSSDPDEARMAQRVDTANDNRKRELELIEERYQLASDECRAEHRRAVVAQRMQIVDALDRSLADLPLGEAWFWCRNLRCIEAGERYVPIIDGHFDVAVENLWHHAQACGARINLSQNK